MQNLLNTVFQQLEESERVVTASAYCQARHKLQPEVFTHLTDLIVTEFYRNDPEDPTEEIERWRGRRLVAIDGSILMLPNTPELLAAYDSQQTAAGTRVSAQATVVYDLLNHVALSALLSRQQNVRTRFLNAHSRVLMAGDILLGDREFGDYGLLGWLVLQHHDFVIRLQSKSFAAAQAFLASKDQDVIVEIAMPAPQKAFCSATQLPTTLRLRLVKVDLSSGEVELLITSLLDTQEYPTSIFKELYGKRWGIETYFNRLKNIFEVERFSGTTRRSIEQDFYGMVFLTTLEAIICCEPDRQLRQRSRQRDCRYTQRVNHSTSYGVLLNTIIALLLDSRKSTAHILEQMYHLMQRNPSIERPDRVYPRKKAPTRQLLRFHKYRKRRSA